MKIELIPFDGKPNHPLPTYRDLVSGQKREKTIHPWHEIPEELRDDETRIPIFKQPHRSDYLRTQPGYFSAGGEYQLVCIVSGAKICMVGSDTPALLHVGWMSDRVPFIPIGGEEIPAMMETGEAFRWAFGKTKIVEYLTDSGEETGTGFLMPRGTDPDSYIIEPISGDGFREHVDLRTEVVVLGYVEIHYAL